MTDDLIRRKDAIDEFDGVKVDEKICTEYDIGFNDGVDFAISKLAVLPSAQRWIPCSERLPEDLEEVNVTWVNHEPEPYYAFIKDKPFTATAVYYKEKWYWYSSTCVDWLAEYGKNPNDEIDDGIEIIAWMPLPEPYKEENNGRLDQQTEND